ncbi:hypothetical protein QVD17_18934 [Tagetes erecta]|uniref:non-specific serine/threonine protein kinase n=1 Tax=Tagetes erecta TaxID=13708 RepID=A0AAD8KIT8_TARER|nr:hypothetical protein QVD17_18934 [Tagetes erecta]
MPKPFLGFKSHLIPIIYLASIALIHVHSQSNDADVMQALKQSINPPKSLDWSHPDPCKWQQVQCSRDNRVTRIQLGNQNLKGELPPTLNNLTELQVLEFQNNQLTGSLPSLAGLTQLQNLLLNRNNFSSIPLNFFDGMSSLQHVYLDYNGFASWIIPDSLKSASNLQVFSATSANITGKIPDFFGGDTFSGLTALHLSFNYLEGGLPESFSGCSIQSLWLNGQNSRFKLNGTLDVLQNMTQLTEVWVHGNMFSGSLLDLSGLNELQNFSVRDNSLTGPVPESLLGLKSLKVVNLTNNMLQGPTPSFDKSVAVDISGVNSFCLPDPGVACDGRVNTLLAVLKSVGYPSVFADNWKGNDPCKSWLGIVCSSGGNITVINFQRMGLTGNISPSFSSITSLQRLILASNNLSGKIPDELKDLPNLIELDVSNNQLYGQVPKFRDDVKVKIEGNLDIGKDGPSVTPVSPSSGPPGSENRSNGGGGGDGGKSSNTGAVVGSVGGVCMVFLIGVVGVCVYKGKRKRSSGTTYQNTMVIHPRHSSSDGDGVKVTIAGSNTNNGGVSETFSETSSGTRDIHVVEAGNMVISIQVLKSVTNNFSQDNILGKGGFGTVYKGELHDGTKIAVKRMESGVMSDKGLDEFRSEIAVLTKVRHRHLVSFLGYCLDGNERLLVYEYMPQGTLSRFLFDWQEFDLKPLEWTQRLIIALDVARAVEYLHGLAQQSFIHRDLKPSNILLGDDMRAKVADFGLVRLAPDGKTSLVTRLAGTFGYLAPEYAVMGRVTTKIDVFSFGVILMELITGRRALDESQQEESVHLVQWFRRKHVNKDTFRKAIDPSLDLDEEALSSVSTVAELAGHCCASEPHQRPDMGHAVNVLSSLAELWKPSEPDPDDIYGIDLDMTLPQAIKKWQALEGMSGYENSSVIGSNDNTQTSIPTRPSGFADSFTSLDGR